MVRLAEVFRQAVTTAHRINQGSKRLVVLVGQKKAVAIAVRNASGRRRWSKLAEWLRPCSPVSRRIGAAG